MTRTPEQIAAERYPPGLNHHWVSAEDAHKLARSAYATGHAEGYHEAERAAGAEIKWLREQVKTWAGNATGAVMSDEDLDQMFRRDAAPADAEKEG
jgi:hypothetical protein